MEFRHLRYFVAVAEELNFSRAAKRLGMKQPPLSAAIRRFEQEMGTELFRRTSRGVELTIAGKQFLDDARALLVQAERARATLLRQAREGAGEIRIGFAGATYFNQVTLATVREYSERNPNITLHPVQMNNAQLLSMLEAEEVDVAILRSIDPERESRITFEPLLREELVLVVPARHALARSRTAVVADLSRERFIMFARELNIAMNDRVTAACRRAGFRPTAALEAPDAMSMIAFVAAGFGIALVPNSVTDVVKFDAVRYVPLAGEVLGLPIHLAYRADDTSPAVLKFKLIARKAAQNLAAIRRPVTG